MTRWLHQILFRLQPCFTRKKIEAELSEEMRAHLEMATEANIAAGMPPDEARCAARREFGGVDLAKELYRDERSILWIEDLLRDLRFAGRALRKRSGSTALAIISIALGIGLTSAIFGVADALIFRPAAFVRPEEVFRVISRGDDQRTIGYDWRDCENMARASHGFGEVVAYQRVGSSLAGPDGDEVVITYLATPNFFSLLGVRAALGRESLATDGDGRPQAVLGHGLWMRRFGGDPAIVGKTIQLNSEPFVVAAVMPTNFTGLVRGVPCDVWISADHYLETTAGQRRRDSRTSTFDMIVRLRPGTAPEVNASRLDAAIRGAGGHPPAPAGAQGTVLEPVALNWQQKLVASGGLLPVFGLLLLVACANAAQLRLAQTEARKKEMGVRLALGSSPWRVARLLIVETLLIGCAGAAGGLLLAAGAIALLNSTVSTAASLELGLGVDWRVGGFTLVATFLASALAGFAPVRHALRLDVLEILKSEDGMASPKNWIQRLLVIGQTAASVVFFGLALLFTTSFRHAAAVWPGFDPNKTMVVIPANPSLPIARPIWLEQVTERLHAVPGVRAVTFAHRLPLSPSGGGMLSRIEVPGQAPVAAGVNLVGPNYFAVMGTRLVAGRGIGPSDREGAPLVAVVSQLLAHQTVGDRNPVGETITIDGQRCQVVGLVEDAPSNSLHETLQPYVYLSAAQLARGDLTLIVETAGAPGPLVRPLLQELKRFDPGVVTNGVTTLRRHVDRALFPDRAAALGTAGLGLLGFLLTAAGLFGMVQFSVNRRTREIGVRMALGAGPETIQRSVLGEALRIASPGVAFGLVLLSGGAWCCQSWFLKVSPLDPAAYAVCALAAFGVSLVAAWLPAHRATRVNPVDALRAE